MRAVGLIFVGSQLSMQLAMQLALAVTAFSACSSVAFETPNIAAAPIEFDPSRPKSEQLLATEARVRIEMYKLSHHLRDYEFGEALQDVARIKGMCEQVEAAVPDEVTQAETMLRNIVVAGRWSYMAAKNPKTDESLHRVYLTGSLGANRSADAFIALGCGEDGELRGQLINRRARFSATADGCVDCRVQFGDAGPTSECLTLDDQPNVLQLRDAHLFATRLIESDGAHVVFEIPTESGSQSVRFESAGAALAFKKIGSTCL